MNIYIGNISLRLNEDHVRQLFEAFGEVASVKLVKDFNTGGSKGTAFVEMKYEAEAKTAIEKLNRCELDGKKMIVGPAKDPSDRKKTAGSSHHGGGKKRF
ncbi:MAG TPA: RNA-binding protein [Cytophagaceae bacterium]|jgi:RNA recognition motif-containing protein|nr:RNA-binding protein [Cytophagaceae bacterium]